MARFANKTFFKFLFGFLLIISASFVVIMGTTYLAEQEAQSNVAQVTDDECTLDGTC